MKDRLIKLLNAKIAQRDALNASMIEAETKEERAAIGETLAALANEIADVEAMISEVDEPADDSAGDEGDGARGIDMVAVATRSGKPDNAAETRANEFAKSGRMVIDNAEARSVLVSSGKLATPTEVSGINDLIGSRVSSVVDLVKVTDASGMGAYKVAYQTADAVAGTKTEGAAYTAGEPTFDFVEIKPQTETVLSYISKQARKQTPLNYAQKVNESALIALRKRAAAIIVSGIIDSDLTEAVTDTAINEKTLRKIALNYGGDESVVGAATLVLNKADLIKFGDVRGANEKLAVYEITPDAGNPNTGVIKDGGLSVPYCIDNNVAENTLLYGQMRCFELAMFSNYEIMVSEDFAFDKGMLAIRGDVELGGDVVVSGGFVKATIGG